MKSNKGKARRVALLLHKKRERRHLKRLRSVERQRLQVKALLSEWITLKCPEFLSIGHRWPRRHLIRFLNKLRYEVLIKKNNVRIDFTETNRIVCDGGILLRAELERIVRLKSPSMKLRCISPAENKTAQVLKQIEVFQLLGHRSSVVPTDDDVVNWNCAHGSANEGEKYDVVLGTYDGVLPEETQTRLYDSFTEAMDNAVAHAYIETRGDGLNIPPTSKDWWMFSQQKDGLLTIVFCDLGIGIPNSLPHTKPSLFEQLAGFFLRKKDGNIIEATIHAGRSRTGEKHRGRGLNQVIRTLENVPTAIINVWSNHGRYSRMANNPEIENYRDSIKGTLISWQLPIESP